MSAGLFYRGSHCFSRCCEYLQIEIAEMHTGKIDSVADWASDRRFSPGRLCPPFPIYASYPRRPSPALAPTTLPPIPATPTPLPTDTETVTPSPTPKTYPIDKTKLFNNMPKSYEDFIANLW